MSLDVYLTLPGTPSEIEAKIFIRENGAMRQLSRAEWDERFPGTEPVVATCEIDYCYSSNITHNLGRMAGAAGIYDCLWRPDEHAINKASQLIGPLAAGLAALKADPQKFEAFNSSNGWGLYKHFVPFVEQYLAACREFPDAEVSVSR